MRCRHCKADINVLETHCPICGKSQSILNDNRPSKKHGSDSLLDRVSETIDTELRLAERRLLDETNLSGSKSEPLGERGRSWRLGSLEAPGRMNLVGEDAVELETTAEDIQQITQFVFYSLHVQHNPLYKTRAGQTTLKYLEGEDTVNAFATDLHIQGIDADPPMIVIFGGLARATRLAGIALGVDRTFGTEESRQLLVRTIRYIGGSIVENGGGFPLSDAMEIFRDLKSWEAARKARSYAAAMNMAVIAHELGHIALGHTLGRQANLEVSRNQEREADSFASSVASASPFSDYIVAGGIFWWVILTWVEAAAGAAGETTHPRSRERLMDYIRANRDQADALGIDENIIADFLP